MSMRTAAKKVWCFSLILSAVLTVGSGNEPAEAESPPPDAKQLYEQGAAAFGVGRFLDAAHDFEQAYTVSQRYKLLWNVAQAYRRQYEVDHDASNLRRAIAVYRNFLDLAPADDKADAQAALASAESELKSIEKKPEAPSPPPTPSATKANLVEPAATAAAPPSPKAAVVSEAVVPPAPASVPRPTTTPKRSRWWIAGVVGGALVIAGGAVAAGVLLRDPGTQAPIAGNVSPGFQAISP